MNKNDLYRAIGEIDDKYIIEAEKSLQTEDNGVQEASGAACGPARHRTRLKGAADRRGWKRWAVAAACALLAIGVVLPLATGGLRMGGSAPKSAANGAYSGGSSLQTAKAEAPAEAAEAKDAISPEQSSDDTGRDSVESAGSAASAAGGSAAGATYENSSTSGRENAGSQETLPGTASTDDKNQAEDWPAAIMVGGTVYYSTGEHTDAGQIDKDDILGYTTAYTDTFPDEDGETNFLRETGAAYARWKDGIVVLLPDGRWLYFTAKE